MIFKKVIKYLILSAALDKLLNNIQKNFKIIKINKDTVRYKFLMINGIEKIIIFENASVKTINKKYIEVRSDYFYLTNHNTLDDFLVEMFKEHRYRTTKDFSRYQISDIVDYILMEDY